jgi:hypothetical protein
VAELVALSRLSVSALAGDGVVEVDQPVEIAAADDSLAIVHDDLAAATQRYRLTAQR